MPSSSSTRGSRTSASCGPCRKISWRARSNKGVEAAVRDYFGKGVEELTLPEAALLAGLPRAPENYSPLNNFERSKGRQAYVLARMVEEGYIAQQEADAAYRN